MTWSLRQAHIARDDGLVDLIAEMFKQLIGYLAGQVVTGIIHGAQQSADPELRVIIPADVLNGIQQGRQTLQRIVFALYRYDHGIGSDQGIHRQHVQ